MKKTGGSRVYLGLGSNLGDRLKNLRQGVSALSAHVHVDSMSAIYQSVPMYVEDQPSFYNAVVSGITDLKPAKLLAFLKKIEADMGRTESVHFGPRIIDFDILFFDDLVLASAELSVPHPQLTERSFVLVPLADIAPKFVHPKLGVTISELVRRRGDYSEQVTKTNLIL